MSDYRVTHIDPACLRIVRRKAQRADGSRFDEGLRRLIELWASGEINPLAERGQEFVDVDEPSEYREEN